MHGFDLPLVPREVRVAQHRYDRIHILGGGGEVGYWVNPARKARTAGGPAKAMATWEWMRDSGDDLLAWLRRNPGATLQRITDFLNENAGGAGPDEDGVRIGLRFMEDDGLVSQKGSGWYAAKSLPLPAVKIITEQHMAVLGGLEEQGGINTLTGLTQSYSCDGLIYSQIQYLLTDLINGGMVTQKGNGRQVATYQITPNGRRAFGQWYNANDLSKALPAAKGLNESALQQAASQIRGALMQFSSQCNQAASEARGLGPDGAAYAEGFTQAEQYIDLARKQLYNLY